MGWHHERHTLEAWRHDAEDRHMIVLECVAANTGAGIDLLTSGLVLCVGEPLDGADDAVDLQGRYTIAPRWILVGHKFDRASSFAGLLCNPVSKLQSGWYTNFFQGSLLLVQFG